MLSEVPDGFTLTVDVDAVPVPTFTGTVGAAVVPGLYRIVSAATNAVGTFNQCHFVRVT